jgi:hypothetical protein
VPGHPRMRLTMLNMLKVNIDSPSGTIAPLAAALENTGYLVERPEMCCRIDADATERSSTGWKSSRRRSFGSRRAAHMPSSSPA